MNRNPRIHLKADCSVIVLPSLTEGFGFVGTEAMASGVPVIVTDEVGAADVVVNGEPRVAA